MSVLASDIVDGHALVQLLWVGAASGLGVTAAFGVALLGVTRAAELSRNGRGGQAVIYAALGVIALAAVAAAVVFGIVVMTQK
jgi:hypothetical protein